MAYAAKISVLHMLQGVPLEKSYEHTAWFDTELAQRTYFLNKKYATYSDLTYIRGSTNTVRVGGNADVLRTCSYMMYQNSAFSNKWFYAFVDDVIYINNETAEVHFTLDVMQTYLFDYRLEQCFVEREHSLTDVVGENTVDERLELGDYFYDGPYLLPPYDNQNSWSVIVAAVRQANGDAVAGGFLEGSKVYSGAAIYRYDVYQAGGINNVELNKLNNDLTDFVNNNQSDAIVQLFMMPLSLVQATAKSASIDKDDNTTFRGNVGSSSDTYVAKNKKLATAPYKFLNLTNNDGINVDMPYEYFKDDKCNFITITSQGCSPESKTWPLNYKGQGGAYREAVTMDNFPICSFAIDSFRAWVAQRKYTDIISTTGNIVSGVMSSGANAVPGLIGQIIGTIGRYVQASTLPDQMKGNSIGYVSVDAGMFGIQYAHAHIRPERARIIDDYFTRYGYATRRVKTPNRNVRPHFTYTQTVGCTIEGNIPSLDEQKICSVYDKGVTFWRNPDEIGNYSVDNTV